MTFHQMADQAEEVLRKFDAVRALAESIRGLGNLEQATVEAKAALEVARGQLAETQALCAKRLAAVQKLGTEDLALSRSISERTEAARAGAAEWIESAKAQAQRIVEDARATAQRKTAEGEAEVKALTNRRSALTVEVAQLEGQIDALKTQAANLIG